jgi:hypothetical protein
MTHHLRAAAQQLFEKVVGSILQASAAALHEPDVEGVAEDHRAVARDRE